MKKENKYLGIAAIVAAILLFFKGKGGIINPPPGTDESAFVAAIPPAATDYNVDMKSSTACQRQSTSIQFCLTVGLHNTLGVDRGTMVIHVELFKAGAHAASATVQRIIGIRNDSPTINDSVTISGLTPATSYSGYTYVTDSAGAIRWSKTIIHGDYSTT